MKGKIYKRLFSLFLCIIILSQVGLIPSFAQESSDDPPTTTVPFSDSELFDVFARLTFYICLRDRVLPSEIEQDTLTSLFYKPYENSSGMTVYKFTGSFTNQEGAITRSYTIPLVCGNKKFWTAAINDQRFKLNEAGNLLLGIGQIIASYFAEECTFTDSSGAFASAGYKLALKLQVDDMKEDEYLLYVPGFTVYQRLWGFFVMDQDVPQNNHIIPQSEFDLPDDLSCPNWVKNGPSVIIQ